MSEKETYESMSFQQLYKVLQETYAKLASKPETAPISPEEFESCLNTLNKLCSLREAVHEVKSPLPPFFKGGRRGNAKPDAFGLRASTEGLA